MNNWNGIGNLGSDPQLRETSSGRAVVNFTIAVDRRYYVGEGANRRLVEDTDWIPVVAWGNQAKSCARYLQKGSKVAISSGTLRPNTYEDREGITHRTFEVVAGRVEFLSGILSSDEAQARRQQDQQDQQQQQQVQTSTPGELPA